MGSRIPISLVYVFSFAILLFGCRQMHQEQRALSKEELVLPSVNDSIVFRTSNEEFLYVCKRLYPLSQKSLMATNDLVTIEGVGDTIFAMFNSELLYNSANPKLPFASDSLLGSFYPKFYNVEIDTDVPYIAYLRSQKDYLQFIKNDDNRFYIENAVIRDTIVAVLGKVKIGMSKLHVLKELGIPPEIIEAEDFSMILCHADVPSKAWYKIDQNFRDAVKARDETIQVYLNFKGGILQLAYMNLWIGYGDKGRPEGY